MNKIITRLRFFHLKSKFLCLLSLTCFGLISIHVQAVAQTDSAVVYFSPDDEVATRLINRIDK